MNNHLKYVNLAIEKSIESYNNGAFPAGAVIVQNDIILTSTISAIYPKIIFHAESNAIDNAMNLTNNQLTDCILYT